MTTMEAYVAVAAPDIQPVLISEENMRRIYSVSRHFPPCSCAFYEFRLTPEHSAVDFIIMVHPEQLSLEAMPSDNPVWSRLQKFQAEWRKTGSALAESVHHICLEFDLHEPLAEDAPPPAPSVFYNLRHRRTQDVETLLTHAPLSHEPLSATTTDNLRKCHALLPENGELMYMGGMLSRRQKGVRLNVSQLRQKQIVPYLRALDWSGSIDTLERLLADVSPRIDRIGLLDIDMGETIGDEIGLECVLNRAPNDEPRWSAFFNFLVSQNLCDPSKAKALLAFPGVYQQQDIPQTWPANLQMADRLIGSDHASLFHKRITHVKINFSGDKITRAKAYLAAEHEWKKVSGGA